MEKQSNLHMQTASASLSSQGIDHQPSSLPDPESSSAVEILTVSMARAPPANLSNSTAR
jgi:hypothetical protein